MPEFRYGDSTRALDMPGKTAGGEGTYLPARCPLGYDNIVVYTTIMKTKTGTFLKLYSGKPRERPRLEGKVLGTSPFL